MRPARRSIPACRSGQRRSAIARPPSRARPSRRSDRNASLRGPASRSARRRAMTGEDVTVHRVFGERRFRNRLEDDGLGGRRRLGAGPSGFESAHKAAACSALQRLNIARMRSASSKVVASSASRRDAKVVSSMPRSASTVSRRSSSNSGPSGTPSSRTRPIRSSAKCAPRFDDPQAEDAGIAFESVHGSEQRPDIRLAGRVLLQEKEDLFDRVQRLAAIVREQLPDFVHLVRHASPCSDDCAFDRSERHPRSWRRGRKHGAIEPYAPTSFFMILASSLPRFSTRS